MKDYYVYVHTNKINGKKYVGQTCQEPKKRWKYGSGYLEKKEGRYTQPLFARAIIKYGWDNFEHEIVAAGLTKEEANDLEKQLIKEFETKNPQKGYNLTDGGEGVAGHKHSEETKRKISEIQKGKKRGPRSEETKEKIRQAVTGYKHTEEAKKKMSESRTGKSNHQEKPVFCVELNTVFSSVKEAEEKTGVWHTNISKVCNNKGLKTAGKMHWQWYVAESAAA